MGAVHHLFLRRKEIDQNRINYTYIFQDQPLSPANQIVTRLFRQMILAVEESLDGLEVEYVDAFMAKQMGARRAAELLTLLGANSENITENKRGEVVLSRTFYTNLREEALTYFKQIKDLEDLSAYRFFSGNTMKVEVYFVKTMSIWVNPKEEEKLLALLEEDRIPYKVFEI
ncbi:hypothetical protein [Ammoniphilus resinae]|uniref:Uncharacterized protein n=1 Tax=Ammoniphilus resinae TaxID=861532 RepID=A0ABS4GRE1_9BACL|nr:hypothetical protein [Ammoniphilus resinae]MBP1932846.1 hypothetical protein [Ammoniphilus resinae]